VVKDVLVYKVGCMLVYLNINNRVLWGGRCPGSHNGMRWASMGSNVWHRATLILSKMEQEGGWLKSLAQVADTHQRDH
jgi:hypothetical protein